MAINLDQARRVLAFLSPNEENGHAVDTLYAAFDEFDAARFENAERLLGVALDTFRHLGDAAGCSYALYLLGLIDERRGDLALAGRHYRDSINVIAETESKAMQYLGALGLGNLELRNRNMTAAYEAYKAADTWATAIGRTMIAAQAKMGIGLIHYSLGDYQTALEWYMAALKIFDDENRVDAASPLFSNIAAVHNDLGQFEEALHYVRRAIAWAEHSEDPFRLSEFLAMLGSIQMKVGDLVAADEALLRALSIAQAIGSHEVAFSVQSNRANIARQRGDLVDAERIYRDVLQNTPPEYGEHEPFWCLIGLGWTLNAANRKEEAVEVFLQALAKVELAPDSKRRYEVELGLANVCADLGRWEEACGHWRRCLDAYTSQFSANLGDQYRTLAEKMRLQLAEKERELFEAKAVALEQDVEHKLRELTSLTLHMAEQRELIRSLAAEVADLKGSLASSSAASVVHKIERRLKDAKYSEAGWEHFDEQFQMLSHSFTEKVARRYPSLTPTELRIIALLKLGMSTKEIARVLAITDRAVEKHRYQIRKKVNLPGKENLITFLQSV